MSEALEISCPLDRDQVMKAVKALKSYVSKRKTANDDGFLEEHTTIQLQVTLHRVPALKQKRLFINLPHTLFPKGADVCLITNDTDKNDAEKSEEHYKNILKENGISAVTKIIPLEQIKKDYRSFESRRKLVEMYDLFLCDRTVMFRMPSLLGKIFFSKRKDPWAVNMSVSSVKQEIDEALKCTRWFLSGNGSCSTVTAAKTTFPISSIVENIMACAVDVVKHAPRGWNNVLSLNIKTDNSIALPVYYNDSPIDVDDLDMRELDFLLRRKKQFEDKKRMMNMIGLKRPCGSRRMAFSKKNKKEDAEEAKKEASAKDAAVKKLCSAVDANK